MTKFNGHIGNLDWSGCAMCRHWNPKADSCEIPTTEWYEALKIKKNEIYCGLFRHHEHEKYDDEKPDQMSLFPEVK